MTREQPTCTTCRFYSKSETTTGECRLNPPVATEGGRRGKWPHVFTTDWCGQHRPFFKVVKLRGGTVGMQAIEEGDGD